MFQVENYEYQVEKLKQCLEDITSVCVLEGFQKQEHLIMVDSVLKELGRAEAAIESRNRKPMLTSKHFISQDSSRLTCCPDGSFIWRVELRVASGGGLIMCGGSMARSPI